MNRSIFFAAFLLFSTGCSEEVPNTQGPRHVVCQCIGVHDGDTITVLTRNKKQYKVRLAHIDCPEKGQPFGENAKQFTSNFCFGKTINVYFEGKKDRNGRVIGEVININGDNLNQALVREGLAWHFKKYSSNPLYDQLEKTARQEKRGFWNDVNSIPPWEWRANK